MSNIVNIEGGIGLGVEAARILTQAQQKTAAQTGPFYPRQWAKPQLYSMTFTVPATGSVVSSSIPGIASPSSTNTQFTPATTNTYFFDGVLSADHDHSSTLTRQPVQDGAPIALNIYRNAPRVVLEVMMSDAMAQMVNGMYSAAASKSVSAWQQWEALKNLGVPITLATRLQSYPNMAIINIRARDEAKTAFALRAVISFEQILMAQVAAVNTSSRPQQTGSTPQGSVNTDTVPPQLVPSHQVTNFSSSSASATPPPGAGNWSSTALGGGSVSAF
jgi:hypothetical protein